MVYGVGSYYPGGLTVNSNGMFVTGGLTLHDVGLVVTDGVTITYSGFTVTGGMSVSDSGLYVTGGLTVNGATNLQTMYNVFSDRRLKSNITLIPNALEMVLEMEPVSYDFTPPVELVSTPEVGRQIGLLAQAMLEIAPEVVHRSQLNGSTELYYTVSYDDILPIIVEAVKHLEELCDGLHEPAATTAADLLKQLKSLTNITATDMELLVETVKRLQKLEKENEELETMYAELISLN